MRSLTFLVFAYKKVELTTACLDSIFQFEPNSQVLFLDNGSQDGSYEFFVNRYASHKNFTHFCLEENLGHAGGLNFLLKKYIEMKQLPDIFVVMDNDAKLIGSVSDKLHNIFSDSQIGVVGKSGYFFIPNTDGFKLFSANRTLNNRTEVDAIATYFSAFRRETLSYGLIDKIFEKFLYGGDDFDLCFNIKLNGYKIIFDPDFPVTHVQRGSSSLLGNNFIEENIVKTNAVLDKKWRPYYPQILEYERNREKVTTYIHV